MGFAKNGLNLVRHLNLTSSSREAPETGKVPYNTRALPRPEVLIRIWEVSPFTRRLVWFFGISAFVFALA
jgi:hypothetical protein